jgi:ribosomal-protein-alanine acetyltransferase
LKEQSNGGDLVSIDGFEPCGRLESGAFRMGLPADRDAVRAILEEANLSAPSPGDWERVTHARIGEVLSVVCERRQEVVGVLQWRNLDGEAEILDLAVSVNHRRYGVATFLLKNFLRQAAASGTQQVFLEVRESNAPAITLYRNFGFQITGRRPNYYRGPEEAALLMRLVLAG